MKSGNFINRSRPPRRNKKKKITINKKMEVLEIKIKT